jgi:hypothetical protein
VSQPDDSQQPTPTGAPTGGEEEEIAPTPFDNPFFLPVILIGFSIWFIYDGWFNPDMEWIKFNRGGAVITLVLGAYYTYRAVRERKSASASASDAGASH